MMLKEVLLLFVKIFMNDTSKRHWFQNRTTYHGEATMWPSKLNFEPENYDFKKQDLVEITWLKTFRSAEIETRPSESLFCRYNSGEFSFRKDLNCSVISKAASQVLESKWRTPVTFFRWAACSKNFWRNNNRLGSARQSFQIFSMEILILVVG